VCSSYNLWLGTVYSVQCSTMQHAAMRSCTDSAPTGLISWCFSLSACGCLVLIDPLRPARVWSEDVILVVCVMFIMMHGAANLAG